MTTPERDAPEGIPEDRATLFIVRGSTAEEAWTQYIIADSPGGAIDAAVKRKSWNVMEGLTLEMPIDFFDATAIRTRGSHD
jgi:hypothetical protein